MSEMKTNLEILREILEELHTIKPMSGINGPALRKRKGFYQYLVNNGELVFLKRDDVLDYIGKLFLREKKREGGVGNK